MKSTKLRLLSALGVAALTFLVFSPTLGYDFVNWDDDSYVYQNPYFHPVTWQNIFHFFTHPYFRSWTPIAFVSHGIDVLVWRFDPFGHHLTNVIVHSLNAALVFWLALMCFDALKRSSGAIRGESPGPTSSSIILGGIVAALLFSLHPLRAESVAWVSDRKDLVCAFFMLLSTIGYFVHVHHGKKWDGWYIAGGVCFILAIGAKSVAMMLPAVWFLIDWLMFKRKLSHCIIEKAPFILIAAVVAVFARSSAPDTGQDLMFGGRSVLHVSAMPITATFFYLGNLVLPLDLSAVYHTNRFLPPAGSTLLVVLPLLFIAVTVFCIMRMKRGKNSWLLTWLSFVVFLLPTFMGLFTGIQPVADRYTYVASICLCILAGGGVELVVRKRKESTTSTISSSMVLGLCLVLIPLYMYKTVQQVGIWRNAETFWPYVTPRAPFALGFNNLGKVYTSKKMYGEAIKSYEQALTLKPAYGEAMNNIGMAHKALGDSHKVMPSFRRAIELQPDFTDAYINLGSEYRSRGMNDSAIVIYRRALTFDSTFALSHYNIGLVLASEGKTADAIAELRNATALDAGNADAWYNLGVLIEGTGNSSGAEDSYARAIGLRPDYFDAYLNLGNVMVSQGRYPKAIEIFSKAIAIKPTSADAHYNLGYTYATIGDVDRALESFQVAVRCDSTYAKAFHGIGIMYQNRGATERSIANFQAAARLGFEDSRKVLKDKGIAW